MNIKFQKTKRKLNDDFYFYDLYVDGKKFPEARCYNSLKNYYCKFSDSDEKLFAALKEYPLYILAEQQIEYLYIKLARLNQIAAEIGGNGVEIKFFLEDLQRVGKKSAYIVVEIDIDPRNWAKTWSIKDAMKAFQEACLTMNLKSTFYAASEDDRQFYDFGIEARNPSPVETLAHHINVLTEHFTIAAQEAIKLLREQSSEKNRELFINFKFPHEIRTACEQYLVYFSQFLADLGIDATSEIKQQANQTLFSIRPIDNKQALQKIQEALGVYLNLPAAPDSYFAELKDPAIQQLHANVMFLKSQLMLAQATIEHKDITIKLLSESAQQINVLPPESKKNQNPSTPSEYLFGRVVEVSSIEKFGFKLNIAELLRMVRRNR